MDSGSLFVIYGIAGLGLGGLLGLALGLWLHHARRSRTPEYAERPSATIVEGPALLGGVVETDDDDLPSPVLAVNLPASTPGDLYAPTAPPYARPFALRLPSGALIRVLPEEGRWSLDTTFVAAEHAGRAVYVAQIMPGAVVYVAGAVCREIDHRVAGKSYRDVARSWAVRAPEHRDLAFLSAAMVALHAERARFHRAWALGLGAAAAGLHGGQFGSLHVWASAGLGREASTLAVVVVLVLGLLYWLQAEATAPWVRRDVRVRVGPR
jgi:hypothetical protein